MKRLFTLFTGLCVMLLAGCNDEYDDSALVKRLDDFEQRLERLERLCNDMNTNLGSMQTIVTALDRGDYITSVEPLTENGSMVGYTIRFAKGTPIVVYNGKPGTAPVVSVKKDTDGIYYWTLDGEWITDGGKKLPVSGQDGTSPKLKIEEEYWYISYDDGTTWTKLDKATGEKGDDGAGILVDMDENYVYFTLPDGRTVTVPRAEGGSEPQPSVPHILYAVGQELVPGQGHYYATLWKDGKRQLLTDGSADSFCNGVYVDGNKVYVVGCEAIGDLFDDGYYEPYPLNVGVMWQFEVGNETQVTRSVLSDGKRATSPVAVAAAGENIYAAGFETLENSDRKAVYWRNGQMEYLSDGSTDALAYCVAAEGNDVYVGGYVQPADNKSGGIACIWKNGVAQNLTDGSTLAKVNAICIDGGVLYAAGAEKVSGGRWKGVLWKDGQPTYFTEEVGTEVTGLYVKEGKYIIEGNMTADSGDIVTCIWTEEGVQVISEGMALCQGTGLAVAGSDIYVAGNAYDMDYGTYEEIYRSPVWKNGTEMALEVVSSDNFTVWGLACAFVTRKSNSARRRPSRGRIPRKQRPGTESVPGRSFLWRSLFAAADRYDRHVDARLLQPLDHRSGRLVVGNDLIDGAHVAYLAESATAELRRIGQHDHLLHRGDHLLVQARLDVVGRRHAVIQVDAVDAHEELAAREAAQHLLGKGTQHRERTAPNHAAQLDDIHRTARGEFRSHAERRRDDCQTVVLADLARHGQRRRTRRDHDRIVGADQPRGIDADGVFLVGIELLLLGHRAVVDVTVHENGRTVHAVQHVLLFEHREILADRHLRNLHQRGERRHRYGVLLTHDLHDAVLTFVQMNHLVRIFHRSS